MSQSFSLGDDFAPSVSLEVGQTIRGKILDLTQFHSTKVGTNEPDYWDAAKTQPKLVYRLTLQTDMRDPQNPNDDGRRSVVLGGSRKSESQSKMAATLDAVRAATGGTNIQAGADYSLTCTGKRPSTMGAGAEAKCYSATYAPPAMNLGGAPNGQAPQQQTWQQQQPPAQPQVFHQQQPQDPWAGMPQTASPSGQPSYPQTATPAPAQAPPAGQLTPEQQAAIDNLTPEQRAAIFGQQTASPSGQPSYPQSGQQQQNPAMTEPPF